MATKKATDESTKHVIKVPQARPQMCVRKHFPLLLFLSQWKIQFVISLPSRNLLALETKVLLFYGWQNLNIQIIAYKQRILLLSESVPM